MLIVIATTAALLSDPSASNTLGPNDRVTIGSSTYFRTRDPAELERQYRRSFDLTDRNADGYIDLSEAPLAEQGHQNSRGERMAGEASNSLWIRIMDTGRDGRVDWPEMRAYLLPRGLRANGL